MEHIISCLSAFIGCMGFAFVFRIHKHFKFALLGSLAGMIGWAIYLIIVHKFGPILSSLFAMIVVALVSEVFARWQKAPATIFNVIGCFPLVPGRGIYLTMYYLLSNDRELFINSLVNTVGTALALSAAILIVSTCFKTYKNIKEGNIDL